MPFVIAIEPDARQAAILKRLVRQRAEADLVLAETKDDAIEALHTRMPDLILVSALLSPRDEADLAEHLRGLAEAGHLQTLTIPLLASSSKKTSRKKGGLLGKLRGKKSGRAPAVDDSAGCDPALFADEVRGYLKNAEEIRLSATARREREQREAAAGEAREARAEAESRRLAPVEPPAEASGETPYASIILPANETEPDVNAMAVAFTSADVPVASGLERPAASDLESPVAAGFSPTTAAAVMPEADPVEQQVVDLAAPETMVVPEPEAPLIYAARQEVDDPIVISDTHVETPAEVASVTTSAVPPVLASADPVATEIPVAFGATEDVVDVDVADLAVDSAALETAADIEPSAVALEAVDALQAADALEAADEPEAADTSETALTPEAAIEAVADPDAPLIYEESEPIGEFETQFEAAVVSVAASAVRFDTDVPFASDAGLAMTAGSGEMVDLAPLEAAPDPEPEAKAVLEVEDLREAPIGPEAPPARPATPVWMTKALDKLQRELKQLRTTHFPRGEAMPPTARQDVTASEAAPSAADPAVTVTPAVAVSPAGPMSESPVPLAPAAPVDGHAGLRLVVPPEAPVRQRVERMDAAEQLQATAAVEPPAEMAEMMVEPQDEYGIHDGRKYGFGALMAKLEAAGVQMAPEIDEMPSAADLLMRHGSSRSAADDVDASEMLDAVPARVEAPDPFGSRASAAEVLGPLTRRPGLAPLAMWARANVVLPAVGAPEAAMADDLPALIAGLELPPGVAAVRYGSGCRIRRVRVPRHEARRTSRVKSLDPVIIVSRKKLRELRNTGD